MKKNIMRREICLAAFLLSSLLQSTQAVDWYVATNGAGLGTNGWADATNNLQGAINAATNGVTVWVSNGLYNTGGVTNYPASGCILTSRVAIWKAITVRSKDNNPTNTIIMGAWHPGSTNGPTAVRCVYMAANAKLIGFTLTNGATAINNNTLYGSTHYDICGGGVVCPINNTTPVISNCIIIANLAYGRSYGGGGAYYGAFYNCTISGCRSSTNGPNQPDSASCGGGAYASVMFNSTLSGNYADGGGGIYAGTLSNCTIIANSSGAWGGGGAEGGTLMYNCRLIQNYTPQYGGGAQYCTLYNCLVISNTASMVAAGVYECTAYNCLLTGNSAPTGGGAGWTSACKLYNCTVAGNSSSGRGGGVNGVVLSNCVVYFNTSSGTVDSNWYGGTVAYSCTASNAPGTGNTGANPLLLDASRGNYRLAAGSPCINTGTNFPWMTNGSVTSVDLDGRRRVRYGTVDMGAYEHIRAGTIYGVR